MKAIGVRELRQRASEFLRQVETGRTLEITAHGRPVARLVPIRAVTRRQQLIEQGRIVPRAGDVLELGPPVPPTRGVPRPTELLRQARADER